MNVNLKSAILECVSPPSVNSTLSSTTGKRTNENSENVSDFDEVESG